MAVNLSPVAGAAQQFFSNAGVPLAGGLLYTYAAGTTTPQATYTDNTGAIANANPIVLDAYGRLPAELWLTVGSNYKFVLQDASAVTIGTYDNIAPVAGTATNIAGGTAGAVPWQSAANTTGFVSAGTSGQVFTSNGASAPSWTSQSALAVGAATTATNIAGGAAGRVPYQTGSGTTGFAAAGTTGQYLISGGTGSPTWGATPQHGFKLYDTAGGTFTQGTDCPVGVTVVRVSVWGGGGGGAGGSLTGSGLGGAGGYGSALVTLTAGQAVTVTRGAGGAGGTTGNNGVAGGTSSFGSFVSCTGGGAGLYAAGAGTAGANGAATLSGVTQSLANDTAIRLSIATSGAGGFPNGGGSTDGGGGGAGFGGGGGGAGFSGGAGYTVGAPGYGWNGLNNASAATLGTNGGTGGNSGGAGGVSTRGGGGGGGGAVLIEW